jgi:hypothetical protein
MMLIQTPGRVPRLRAFGCLLVGKAHGSVAFACLGGTCRYQLDAGIRARILLQDA